MGINGSHHQQISTSIAQRFPNTKLGVNGHTDSVGNDAYNLNLSQQRAESVKQWLVANQGMQSDRLTTEGSGENQPISPNTNPDKSDNPAGRQQNVESRLWCKQSKFDSSLESSRR